MWRTSTSERIREEVLGDEARIAEVTAQAFAAAEHADGTEAAIIDRLREAGALALSLVAEAEGEIVGHAAFSPVTIDGDECRWFGLGPVAVLPERQGRGVGSALIGRGLDRLRAAGAHGCVVLGDPGFYGRFGFVADARLVYPGPPSEYFQRMLFSGPPRHGTVAYAPGFGA